MSELRLNAEPTDMPAETDASWQTKLLEYAHQLSVLKVVTYVGGAEIGTDENGLVNKVTITQGGRPLLTVIDLVGGDLTNVVDPSLKGEADMVKFHGEQVQKAAAVLPSNLKLLGEFVKSVFKNS